MTRRPRRRATGESGASLLLALGFLALCGALIPAIVNLSGVNLIDTSRLHEQRNGVYAADGAVDGAIQYLRDNTGCGRTSGSCPNGNTFSATLNGVTSNVAISLAPFNQLDRKVNLDATLAGQSKVRVHAEVTIRDSDQNSTVGNQPVDVTRWVYNR